MAKYVTKTNLARGDDGLVSPGTEIDLDDKEAQRLLRDGNVELLEEHDKRNALQKQIDELTAKHEAEIAELRAKQAKQVADAEKKALGIPEGKNADGGTKEPSVSSRDPETGFNQDPIPGSPEARAGGKKPR